MSAHSDLQTVKLTLRVLSKPVVEALPVIHQRLGQVCCAMIGRAAGVLANPSAV
jgi:hypothetical protein